MFLLSLPAHNTAEMQPFTPMIECGPSPGIFLLSQFELTNGNLIKQFVLPYFSLRTLFETRFD